MSDGVFPVDCEGQVINRVEFDDLGRPFSPLRMILSTGKLIALEKAGFDSYRVVTKECNDCRVLGTLTRPSFWID